MVPSSIFGKSHTEGKMDDKTPAGSVNLLDDTLLESPTMPPLDPLAVSQSLRSVNILIISPFATPHI